MYVRGNNECSRQVGEAVRDAYKRLLKITKGIFSLDTVFAFAKQQSNRSVISLSARCV